MKKVLVLAIVMTGIVFNAGRAAGQDLPRYRDYVLGSSLATVAKASGTAASEARTTHERPAKIQSLKWRAPYSTVNAVGVDPVRDILFNFADDTLYQIVVSYDSARIEGLTDGDLIDALSVAYGEPALVSKGMVARSVSAGVELPSDTVVVARWDTPASSVMLVRGMYSSGLQLMLTSKPLYTTARAAITEAVRLDSNEAPQREIDSRARQATAATAAQAKARAQNKVAFKP